MKFYDASSWKLCCMFCLLSIDFTAGQTTMAPTATTTDLLDGFFATNTAGRDTTTPADLFPDLGGFPDLGAINLNATTTLAPIAVTKPPREFNLKGVKGSGPILSNAGFSERMMSGRAPFTAREAVLLAEANQRALVRNVTQRDEFPWVVVLTSAFEEIPEFCHGALIDNETVITTTTCYRMVTSIRQNEFHLRIGLTNVNDRLQNGSEASMVYYRKMAPVTKKDRNDWIIRSNDTSVTLSPNDTEPVVNVFTDPTGNLTIIRLPDKISAKMKMARPIFLAPNMDACYQRCKGGGIGIALGSHKASDFEATAGTFVSLRRALLYLPQQNIVGYDEPDEVFAMANNGYNFRDGTVFGAMRLGRMHLCGLLDESKHYVPICSSYEWLVNSDYDDVAVRKK